MKSFTIVRLSLLCAWLMLLSHTAGAATLTLAWDPPSDPSVVGYIIRFGTQSGVYTAELDAGNASQSTIANLSDGINYYFVVQSYNAARDRSAPSNEVIASPTVGAAAVVTGLSLLSSVASPQPIGAQVQWTTSVAGGVPPYQYKWYVLKSGIALVTLDWSTASTFTWAPDAAGSDYVISVSVRSAGGQLAEMFQRVPFTIVAPAAVAIPPRVLSLTLIDASTDRPVAAYDPIANGVTFRLAKLPSRKINMRANVEGTAAKVVLVLDGRVTTTDTVAPYSLMGDVNGNYLDWTPSPGAHTVQAIPYGTDGVAGAAYALTFTVR